ncbi:MAG: TerB family tellurite resistance protein [Ignavibacteria bacterium]|jgi:uncharacterized tellurite resistance protein B-like protein
MFDFLKEVLLNKSENEQQSRSLNSEARLQIATCALFLELGNADDEFTIEEEEKIFELMKNIFELNDEHVKELIGLSKEQVNKSVSLYEFTEIINNHFSFEEKFELVKNLWRLIYADEKLHAYEEYFIRKVSGNLHLHHQEMIGAKLEVKKELGLS